MENDSGFITSSALTGYATETWVGQQGYLTSVAWGDIAGKPTFATVATSGSYNDLTNKPTIPTNYVTTDTAQTITGSKVFSNQIQVRASDGTVSTMAVNGFSILDGANDVEFSALGIKVGDDPRLNYSDIAKVSQLPTDNNQLANGAGYQTASDVSTAVSTAISSQTKETWTFTLEDGTTVNKSVVLG